MYLKWSTVHPSPNGTPTLVPPRGKVQVLHHGHRVCVHPHQATDQLVEPRLTKRAKIFHMFPERRDTASLPRCLAQGPRLVHIALSLRKLFDFARPPLRRSNITTHPVSARMFWRLWCASQSPGKLGSKQRGVTWHSNSCCEVRVHSLDNSVRVYSRSERNEHGTLRSGSPENGPIC